MLNCVIWSVVRAWRHGPYSASMECVFLRQAHPSKVWKLYLIHFFTLSDSPGLSHVPGRTEWRCALSLASGSLLLCLRGDVQYHGG